MRTFETCYRLTPAPGKRHTMFVAGNAVLRQMPPTAKGFMFIMLEDETGYIQVIVPPKLCERLGRTLQSPSLIIRAELEATGNWRGLLLKDAWVLALTPLKSEGVSNVEFQMPKERGEGVEN